VKRRRITWGRWAANLLLVANLIVLAAIFWRLNQPPRPDPAIVGLAVRATVFALPTPTPYIVEVQVTRIYEITRLVQAPTPIPTATPAPPPSATPEPSAATATPPPAAERSFGAAAAPVAAIAEKVAPAAVPAATVAAPAAIVGDASACPATSSRQYTTIPVVGQGDGRTDYLHGDLNLSLRGYTPVEVPGQLINKDGPVDSDPPQLAGIFADGRLPGFGQSYRVYDWDWGCGDYGCRGGVLDHVLATLVTFASAPGEAVGIPHRGAQIYGGGYKALVLYAEETRITLGYTRDDSVAHGYAVHIENVCVDPGLLAQYRASNGAGRAFLPALREDEALGTASLGDILVAVRDRGVFFDPRSRLDWWHGF
jgi:hypothetical protein